jgi:hypothetical protein
VVGWIIARADGDEIVGTKFCKFFYVLEFISYEFD